MSKNKLDEELDEVLNDINKERENVTEKIVMDYFYEDKFLKIFDNKYITLSLHHQNNKYNYSYNDKNNVLNGGGNIFDMTSNSELTKIRKQIVKYIKLYNKIGVGTTSVIHNNVEKLYLKFSKYLNREHQIIIKDNPLYLYQTQSYKGLENKIPSSKTYINKKINNKHSFLHFHIDLHFEIFDKYSNQLIYNILDAIHNIKKHGNILLYIPSYFGTSLFLLFANIFEDVNLIYPTYLSITKGNIYCLLKNKINEVKLPKDINFQIKIYNCNIESIKKINSFIVDIHKIMNDYYVFSTYLNWIKLNNDKMYNILYNKIIETIV